MIFTPDSRFGLAISEQSKTLMLFRHNGSGGQTGGQLIDEIDIGNGDIGGNGANNPSGRNDGSGGGGAISWLMLLTLFLIGSGCRYWQIRQFGFNSMKII